jgi:ribosomal 30S subunit maturation factor RimM
VYRNIHIQKFYLQINVFSIWSYKATIYIYIKDEIGWVKIKSEIIKNKLESCKLSNTKDNQERRRETMKKEDNFFFKNIASSYLFDSYGKHLGQMNSLDSKSYAFHTCFH